MVRKLNAGWGVGQIWTASHSRLRENSFSHLFCLVQTCPNLFTMQWPCMLVTQSHFLHFRRLLFFSLRSYPAEIASFNSSNRELSNSLGLVELYWNTNVDPCRSPFSKTVDRKSFERRNFLVLRPVLLKMHISTQLIKSYRREYGSWSCTKEKLSIPLEAHDKAQSSEIFLSFQSNS